MNWVLIKNTLLRVLTRPLALVAVLIYALYLAAKLAPLVLVAPGMMDPGAGTWTQSASSAWVLVWILGTGLLGQERAEGTLPLLLSRPVSRMGYVLSRWAGLVLSVLAVDLGLVVLAVLWLSLKGHPPDLVFVLQRLAWFGFFTVLTSSWLAFLSASFSRNGDLLYQLAASIILYLLTLSLAGAASLSRAHDFLALFWEPGGASFDLMSQGQDGQALLAGLGFALAAAASLFAAAFVMKRRDISYVNR